MRVEVLAAFEETGRCCSADHHGAVLWQRTSTFISKESKIKVFFFYPLSCPALWQQNYNLNTVLCRFFLLCFMNVKPPYVSQILFIYSFLLKYFTCNRAEPDRERGRVKKKKLERNRKKQSEKTM